MLFAKLFNAVLRMLGKDTVAPMIGDAAKENKEKKERTHVF